MLPMLSICDMLAAALAFLAIVNPLRCGAFLRRMSAKWNDELVAWYVQMGVSENVVYPIVPNGFADHYPYEKWLFHWEYTQHFQTNPDGFGSKETAVFHWWVDLRLLQWPTISERSKWCFTWHWVKFHSVVMWFPHIAGWQDPWTVDMWRVKPCQADRESCQFPHTTCEISSYIKADTEFRDIESPFPERTHFLSSSTPAVFRFFSLTNSIGFNKRRINWVSEDGGTPQMASNQVSGTWTHIAN